MNTLSDLALQQCIPCKGGEESLSLAEIDTYRPSVPEWKVVERESHPQLVREFQFADFQAVLGAVAAIGSLAEREGHHPNLYIHDYRRLRIEIFTHKTKGLHLNDFILARKIDLLAVITK